MNPLQGQIDKLTAEYQRKIAEATREESIRELLRPLIDGYEPPSIHFYSLYGSVGGIHFRRCEYDSIRKGNHADRNLLAQLLSHYPPVGSGQVKVSDGCTSFRPDLGYSYSTEQRTAEEYECFGVVVRVKHNPTVASLHWYALLGGETWRIEFDVPFHLTDFGRLDMVASRYGGNGPVARWERCNLIPTHNAQVVRWASGGSEYPNTFTLYWDRDTGAALDLPAIAFARVQA